MNTLVPNFLTAFLLLSFAAGLYAAEPSNDEILAKAREVVTVFQGALSSKLQAAMQAGGPVNAIDVCSKEAQLIAQQTSTQHTVMVKRISGKPRNLIDTADAEEIKVLAEFAMELKQQADSPLEKLVTASNGKLRYYKGIVIQPLCLNCHGDNLAPAVLEVLQERYPEDKAIGYKIGDLRGAFVVEF